MQNGLPFLRGSATHLPRESRMPLDEVIEHRCPDFDAPQQRAAAVETSMEPNVQLAVNRQPGYRQGTRRASCSVLVCFCVFSEDPTKIIIFGSHMTNFLKKQLRAKLCTGPPPLHAAKYYRYLSDCQASRRSYRQRRRKSRTSIRHKQKCATGGKPSTCLPPGDS